MDGNPATQAPRAASGRTIQGFDSTTLRRDAVVESVVGGTGRLKHVVVHPETREVTGLVILHEGSEWLVPVREISAVAHNRIRLRGAWSRYQRREFDRACFRPVSPADARATSDRGATHDGSPLLDAGRSQVRIGMPAAVAAPGAADQSSLTGAGSTVARPRLLDAEQQRRLRELEQAGVIHVTRRSAERIETIEVPVHEQSATIELAPAARAGGIAIGDEEIWDGERLEVTLSTERIRITRERLGAEEAVPDAVPDSEAGGQESAAPVVPVPAESADADAGPRAGRAQTVRARRAGNLAPVETGGRS